MYKDKDTNAVSSAKNARPAATTTGTSAVPLMTCAST